MSTQLAQALQLDVEHWKKLGDNAERDGDWSVADVYRVCADQLREALAAFEAAPQQAQAPFTHAVATTTNGRPGITIYDLGPSLNPDSAIKAKLIEMGWTPPSKQAQAPGWQPIETAPQGTMILCANMKAREARDWCYVAWLAGEKICGHRMDMPTHWMPLPAAPQQGSNT